MGADQAPDSLEKTPRATPFWIAILTVAPAKPPDCSPVKAPENTDFKAGSNWIEMQGNDRDSRKDIGSSHKREPLFRDFGNPVNSTKDDGRNH